MQEESRQVNHFWQAYRAAVSNQGVPDSRADWFVRWAQRFARAMPGIPLRGRTKAHVRAFLSNLAQQVHVESWQADQAREALRVLYQECLPQPWARPWPFHTPAMEAARGRSQGASFRDEVAAHEVEARHQAVLSQLQTAMRTRHYSFRTEQAYVHWMRRFVTFHELQSPQDLGPEAVKAYLDYLAVAQNVSASTQNQALNALVFLYEQVMGEPLGTIGEFTRAKRPKRLPVVLTREEVNRMLGALPETYRLMAGLLYGSGLRLMECVRLRVKDVDFAHHQIVVRDGEGQKDRGDHATPTVSATAPRAPDTGERAAQQRPGRRLWEGVSMACLGAQIPQCRTGMDLAVCVSVGPVVRRPPKWNGASSSPPRERPATGREGDSRQSRMDQTGELSRPTPFLCHASSGGGSDIRTVQELLGHADVSTTMIYTHVLNRPGLAVTSPADVAT